MNKRNLEDSIYDCDSSFRGLRMDCCSSVHRSLNTLSTDSLNIPAYKLNQLVWNNVHGRVYNITEALHSSVESFIQGYTV